MIRPDWLGAVSLKPWLLGPLQSLLGGAWRRTRTPPGATTPGATGRPDKLTVCVTVAFVVTTLGVFTFDLHSRYHAAIAASKASTLSYAQILAEHTARTLEGVDHILKEAAIV